MLNILLNKRIKTWHCYLISDFKVHALTLFSITLTISFIVVRYAH